MFWFGLPALENSPATWAARAIDDGSSYGFVPGRHSFDGETAEKDALLSVLNGGALAAAHTEWARLRAAGEMPRYEAPIVTLYEDILVKIECRTNGGYVYLRGFIKPEAYTATRLSGYPEGGPDAIPAGSLVWSHAELPEVGEVIYVPGWTCTDGRVRVLGYAAEHGHMFVVGTAVSPTEEWTAHIAKVKAEALREGKTPTGCNVCVMGREWERFRVEANGFAEAADAAEYTRIRAIEDRDLARSTLRALVKSRARRHAHVTEVYVVLFREGEDCILADRQYTPVGTMTVEDAKALMGRSVIGSTWESYSIGGSTGTAVWLAYPNSSDTRTWDADNTAETVIAGMGI